MEYSQLQEQIMEQEAPRREGLLRGCRVDHCCLCYCFVLVCLPVNLMSPTHKQSIAMNFAI